MAEWDRLPAESDAAYSAFVVYLRMDKPRSIDGAWRATAPQQERGQRRAPGHWNKWSAAHEWMVRTTAYEAHLAEQDRLIWEQRRRRKKERDWDAAEALRDVIDEAIPQARQFIRRRTAFVRGQDGAPDREIITMEFDITGLATVLEKVGKVQALALGEATENVQFSGAALDDYIASQLERLANGAKASSGATPE